MTIEYDNFPRGFYFAPGTQKALPGFSKVELLPNLFVHEWCWSGLGLSGRLI